MRAARFLGTAAGLSWATVTAASTPVEVQSAARALLVAPLPDELPTPDTAAGEALWQQVLAHPEWSAVPMATRLVWRGHRGQEPLELDLALPGARLAAVYLCLADDAQNRALDAQLQLVPEPPRDCDLSTLKAPEVVLERAGATRFSQDAFLDKHWRYVDLASCCASPQTPRQLDCPDCEHRDQLIMDARTAECLVYDQRETSIDPGFDPTWDGTWEEEPPVRSFRCVAPLPDAPEVCGVERMLQALIDLESALQAQQPSLGRGDTLTEAADCVPHVPRTVAGRVLRAIGATRPAAERAAWWSAARELEPSFRYGDGDVSPELLQADAALEPVPWRHLSLARRVVDDAQVEQEALLDRYARIRHGYSVLPMPRGWAVLGAGPDGPAHGLGASIGAGSTFVAFAERSGASTFVGAGTHSFIGDTYSHSSDGRMMCTVLHRHHVRPGLLLGGVRDEDGWGLRVRPEVSLGAFANLLVAVPVTWQADRGLSLGVQAGVALGIP